jgi:hypothetical protein
MLIAQQAHEATYVAGFNSWKQHGRFVRKGERGLSGFSPPWSTSRSTRRLTKNRR